MRDIRRESDQMERRVAVSLRLPEELLAEVRQVATDEERPLNTQLIRFIRSGLDQRRQAESSPESTLADEATVKGVTS
jgi:hypothetical protein